MNIFELFGTIAVHNDEANKSIDATSKKAKELQTKMGKTFDKIGKSAIACGKVIAKGLTVASAAGVTALTALSKSSVSAYADFEQLSGGIKKLFGEDVWETVKKNADKAYKTAGLSANAYMETATSFAASLISGLEGNTAHAAELTDMAIQDMADNANTFGTEISMIQNAYQGFAKQNYTMLDNLKLGYGGTQEEMARLINESGVLGKTVKVTAETVNDVSFAKIIEAIHVVQSEMSIAGTTANEASTTISGSFSAWKATWTNLLTGMAGDENIDPLIDAFFDAGQTVLQNVGKVLPKIANNIGKTMQRIGISIKTWMSGTVWPSIQEFAKVNFGIDLPTWAEMETTVSTWWANTKTTIENFCQWTLKLFNEPAEAAADAGKAISDWWEDEGKPGVLSASSWALNIFGHPVENADSVKSHVKSWWKLAGQWVIDACSWTLKLFGMPSETADTIKSKASTWWSTVSSGVVDAVSFTAKFLGFSEWTEEDSTDLEAWWKNAEETINSVVKWLMKPELPEGEQLQAFADELKFWWQAALELATPFVLPGVKFARNQMYIWNMVDGKKDAVEQAAQLLSDVATDPTEYIEKIDETPQDTVQAGIMNVIDAALSTENSMTGWVEAYTAMMEKWHAYISPKSQKVIDFFQNLWNNNQDEAATTVKTPTDMEETVIPTLDLKTEEMLERELDELDLSTTVTLIPDTSLISPAVSSVGSGFGAGYGGRTNDVRNVLFNDPTSPISPKWNAAGAVFSRPTIFDTRFGLQGVGEAGPEAVAPIGVLQDYVANAVRSETGSMFGKLESVYNSMLNVLQTIAENTGAGQNIVLDSGALVGQIAPRMDMQLGMLGSRKARRG